MKISRVLLATKTTLMDVGRSMHATQPLKRLLDAGDPLVADEEPGHRKTVETISVVKRTLEQAGIEVTHARRRNNVSKKFDLVIAVGGDGTVLDIARFIRNTPLLAVNSSPSTSFGHFCATTSEGFPSLLELVLSDRKQPASLTRAFVTIDGRRHPQPALNDVLFANVVPSATSRYVITVAGVSETHKSSGVWISTAAGSTGAMLSAGGSIQDLQDTRLQYLVREPFGCRPDSIRYRLVSGMLGDEGIVLQSRMIRSGVYLDGRRTAVPVDFGSRITVTPDGPPLLLFR
ncbi:MAG TPA: NAD(+)/NADH kinase [Myxococcota bacterium]|nr:NAD(+)/NADH kinase [Myxococcota bacterium]HOA14001.1 NAD(+)/NADH kinase [Myxococcota bacterium]HOH77094.1 NAD(+)/NADH kinase [Myxococcota bacterium]HPV04206.1 NAD(+)/NADH kinase [Myxococcota bacterium]